MVNDFKQIQNKKKIDILDIIFLIIICIRFILIGLQLAFFFLD